MKKPSLFLLLFFLCAVAATAQFDTATVPGTVKDSQGSAISGATVTLKDLQNNSVATAHTND